MNELKEAITKIISQDGWVDIQEVPVEKEVDDLMHLIEAYTTRKELEARIDEATYIRDELSSDSNWDRSLISERIDDLNQLSSQLKESL